MTRRMIPAGMRRRDVPALLPALAPPSVRPLLTAIAWLISLARVRTGVRIVVLPVLAGLICGACSSPRRRPTRPGAPLSVAWVSPAAGDSVAGLVTLEVELHGDGARAVIFRAGDAAIDSVVAPPWTTTWHCPFLDRPAPVTLGADIRRPDGTLAAGATVAVRVVPDRPPSLSVRPPRPTVWIEKTSGICFEAAATDPEEGPLPPARIRWTGSSLDRPVTGPVLPVEILREEAQRIVVEAKDRWNESARETLLVRPFRYPARETPPACADAFATAVRALDPAGLTATLSDSFLFVPCADQARSAGWAPVWSRDDFVTRAASWLQAPASAWIEFTWDPVRLDTWRSGSDERAWLECARAVIRFPGGSGSDAAEGSLLLLSMCRRRNEPWRIETLRELAPDRGPSLASLLARANGLPAPAAGSGCRTRSPDQDGGSAELR